MSTDVPSWLDAGAGSATCALLQAGTAVAATVAANSARTLALWPTIGAAGAALGFAGLAHAMNCSHNPGRPPGSEADPCGVTGGWSAQGADVYIEAISADALYAGSCGFARASSFPRNFRKRIAGGIVDVEYDAGTTSPCGTQVDVRLKITRAGGAVEYVSLDYGQPTEGYWKYGGPLRAVLEPVGGTATGSVPDCGNQPSNDPSVYNFSYTDDSTSCTFNYKLADAWIASDGFPRLAWHVDGASQQTKAGCQGGRITGYVWAPTTQNRYTFNPSFDFSLPGGGGGGIGLPGLPGGGGGGGGGGWRFDPDFGAIMDLIFKVMSFNDPGDLYRLVSVCETDAEGEPISRAVEVNIPPGVRDAGASTRVRLEAIVQLLQGLKDFKQPICEPVPPAAPVGRNISIQFRSVGVSPFGKDALRKVFRYRDPSLKDLAEHVGHWEDFEWESGPWMVISQGLTWGKPRVWAKSEAEGKRVLTHAAQIAGMNLNSSSHRWVVREVDGYRERPVMNMRVHRDVNGRPWIAERTGSDGLPMVLDQLSSNINVEG